MELMGSATHLRQGYGAAGIEGKVARVATSKLGNERVSISNPALNPGVILARCLQCGLLAIGSVSLPIVTARVDRFMTEDGNGPYPDMDILTYSLFANSE